MSNPMRLSNSITAFTHLTNRAGNDVEMVLAEERLLPVTRDPTDIGLFHSLDWWSMDRMQALWRRFEGPTWALTVVIYGGWGLLIPGAFVGDSRQCGDVAKVEVS
jgi:hypothetical protein